MVKIEKTDVLKCSAKGILKDITAEGFEIIDEKEQIVEVLTFAQLKEMIGRSVVFSVTNKELK
jgi:hypothetical protein